MQKWLTKGWKVSCSALPPELGASQFFSKLGIKFGLSRQGLYDNSPAFQRRDRVGETDQVPVVGVTKLKWSIPDFIGSSCCRPFFDSGWFFYKSKTPWTGRSCFNRSGLGAAWSWAKHLSNATLSANRLMVQVNARLLRKIASNPS